VKRAGFLAGWLDAHPEGWSILVRRAAGGDPSAVGGLAALGQDDPAVVREQVGALDRGLAERLGLPAVDPGVDAVLAEVEPVSVPVGRRLSMTRVSAHVREYDYPMWDNANYATGWIRVTGFVSPVADALVFQSICTGLGEGNIRREIHRMGPPGHTVVHRLELLPEEALFSWDGDALVCVATGVRQVRGVFHVPPEGARRAVYVPLVGAEVPLAADTSAMKPPVAEQFARLGPELGLMARLGQDHRGVVLASGDALRQLAGLDPGAVRLFEFDAFVSPLAGEPATVSIDLVAMVEALRRRLPITRLPRGGHPLAGLYDRLQVPHIQWGNPKFLG
jgi:hypothetical protein